MATSTVQMKQYECDAPGCEHIALIEVDEGPPYGWYVGEVAHSIANSKHPLDGEDVEAEWTACQRTHVGRAITAMIEREMEDEAGFRAAQDDRTMDPDLVGAVEDEVAYLQEQGEQGGPEKIDIISQSQ